MNTRTRTILFNLAAPLLLAGAILHFVKWAVAPYLFAFGAAGITIAYLTLPLTGLGPRGRRLHRTNIIAGLLLLLASGMLFAERKEWVLCLTISALLQLYTAFVRPKEGE